MARHGYPSEFGRRVLDLAAVGKKVSEVAHDLSISEQSIYAWRRRDEIDLGPSPRAFLT